MLVRNLKESNSQIVNIDIIAVRPSKLRMEVTTPMGFHLASFVMTDSNVKYLVTREKKFFNAPASAAAMKKVLGIELDPKLMMNVLFDEAPQTPEWACESDKKGYLAKCVNEKRSLNISWEEREVARKKVVIESKSFSLQMTLQGFTTKVEEKPDTFTLNAPGDFGVEKL